MKFYKKLLRGGVSVLMMTLSLAFIACSNDDTEDDDALYVEFTVSGSESDSSRDVTMKAPAGYEGKDIKIVYTLDGSTPDLNFTPTNYGSTKSVAEYVDYGTATLYEDKITIGETTTIKAIAFYVDATAQKCVKGSAWSSKIVTISAEKTTTATTNTATGASSGTFTFTLAETGNSNSTHYFDTYRTNVFKLNDEHPTVYYQTQFSWKGNNKGNWYLYMRDLNGGLVKASEDSNFLAKGTYTGACFNSTKGVVSPGELTLYNGTDTTNGKKATVEEVTSDDTTTYKFELKVNNSGAVASASSGSGSSTSYDTLGTFTVDAK